MRRSSHWKPATTKPMVIKPPTGITIIPQPFPAMQMVMPVGGFLILGVVLAGNQKLMKYLEKKSKKKEAAK